jgi:hypothetical protein
MTRAYVQQVIKALEASGQVVSIRRVRKLLGGGSFLDLLPLLQNQQDKPSGPRYQRVVDMAEELEVILTSQRHAPLPGVIARAEETWRVCVPAMYTASARGESTQPWATAFERLRLALAAAILRHAQPPAPATRENEELGASVCSICSGIRAHARANRTNVTNFTHHARGRRYEG